MNALRILVVGVTLLAAGCATCERHPVACSVAAGVIITSVALSVHHDQHAPVSDRTERGIPCGASGDVCRP
jgi:hypothetical protein